MDDKPKMKAYQNKYLSQIMKYLLELDNLSTGVQFFGKL